MHACRGRLAAMHQSGRESFMILRRALTIMACSVGTMHVLPAYALDYPIDCSGVAVDDAISAAIAQTVNGPVRAVLSSGTCVIQSTHRLDGAIAFSMVGAGAASTIVQ